MARISCAGESSFVFASVVLIAASIVGVEQDVVRHSYLIFNNLYVRDLDVIGVRSFVKFPDIGVKRAGQLAPHEALKVGGKIKVGISLGIVKLGWNRDANGELHAQ